MENLFIGHGGVSRWMSFHEPITKILVENVCTVRADASVKDAAKLMIEKRISCLPVSMGQGAIGMVTEKDILGKVVATGADSRKIHVGDIMSTPLILATMDITIGEAAKKMMENNIRRLVVSDQNGRLLGLVTMTDLIRWVARGDEHATAVSDFLGSESQ